MIRRRLVIAILLVVLFALGWWSGRVASRDLYADLDLFVEVLHKVEANYVDPVEPTPLVDGAIKGMLRQLDPYSQYLDEKAYANLRRMAGDGFRADSTCKATMASSMSTRPSAFKSPMTGTL